MDGRRRSRSPYSRDKRTTRKTAGSGRQRSRSPHRRRHHKHGERRHQERSAASHVALPFQQQPLDKHDLEQYEGLLAEYLDVQKQIDIRVLTREEVKGRWKSFLGKWNRRELAEGWYDPAMQQRATERYQSRNRDVLPQPKPVAVISPGEDERQEDESDDGYGPALPREGKCLGPTIPNTQELQHRQELVDEAAADARAERRYERKLDREEQKGRLEELAPRADPGSHERKLEKKQDTTSTLHAFREAKDGGDVDVGESVLMGEDDGIKGEIKRREKAKSEREIRKEEALRARMAEREERMRGVRAKEEKTIEMLKAIARERFG